MDIEKFISSFSSQPIYIDSNIFLYTIFKDTKYFASSYALLRNIEENKVQAVISCLVIDEVCYKLIIEGVKVSCNIPSYSKIFREIDKNPSIMEVTYPALLGFYTVISNYKHLKIVPLYDYSRIFHNITQFHLLPRDVWHLSILQQEGIKYIATNDKHFQNIPNVTRVIP